MSSVRADALNPTIRRLIERGRNYQRGKAHCQPYFKLKSSGLAPRAAAVPGGEWDVPSLCAAYNWPTGLVGGGVIAIIEMGGGWVMSDITQFCNNIHQPVPKIVDVSVDGAQNSPDPDPQGPDGEVALDIEIAAASYYIAAGRPATIRVYWSADITKAIRQAAADGCDVCSISWGADEAKWNSQDAQDLEQAAEEATNVGMVIFAASGDNDSSDGGPNPANVDLPASAPHVVGCGGTSKTAASETVWNNNPGQTNGEGTGGGYSTIFSMPGWQIGAPHGPGRMAPDVSANADPDTGYKIILHGNPAIVGGTSAVAPLYAGLFAAFGQKLGFVTPELYLNQTCFNDITAGDNGAFRAKPGPDPCTGIGSPIGNKLERLLVQAGARSRRAFKEVEAENEFLRRALAELSAQ